MRGLAVSVGLALLLLPAVALAAEFTDATGRTVTTPDAPARVFAAGPPAGVLLYALKPEAMIGWPHAPRDADKPYLLAASRDLPELPPLTSPDEAVDLAALEAADPQLIVDFGTINDDYIAAAERVQGAGGVPYLLIDGALDATPAALRDLGAALGVADRGAALAAYAEATLALVAATLAEVPGADRPRVYLARGADGLQSARRGSINAEAIEFVGAANVVDVGGSGNLVEASLEQIAAWAPDVILTVNAGFAATAAASPDWSGVPAVAEGRVLVAPSAPFGFIDSPPSVNRLIGLRWLLHALYPEEAQGDLRADVREFYALFYQVELDDAALGRLLAE